MIVNGTTAAIGNPPFTPVYNGWLDCWSYLPRHRLHKRTDNFFSRPYTGPVEVDLKGDLKPIGVYFGPTVYPRDGQQVPWLLTEYYKALASNSPAYKVNFDMRNPVVNENRFVLPTFHKMHSF
jgi:hypothetical protein